jgi:hypothetical protein
VNISKKVKADKLNFVSPNHLPYMKKWYSLLKPCYNDAWRTLIHKVSYNASILEFKFCSWLSILKKHHCYIARLSIIL